MRAGLVMLMILWGALSLKAQRVFIDRAPNGKQNMRAAEGGSRPVPIDTVTSLETLISRLNMNWQLVETGKGYWIGYTDDMYSIAARKEAAIDLLLLFARTSANEHGRHGVAYCLHLIGIDSRIAGRTYEEFTGKKARAGLLSLLNYPQLNPVITRLLLRDPWQSDVPYVVAALRQPSDDSWPLVNALKYYSLPGLPIQQEIPQSVGEVSVRYPRVAHHTMAERQAASARHEMNGYNAQVMGILQAIQAQHLPTIQVEESLLQSQQFWGYWSIEFGCKNCIGVGGKMLLVSTFLKNMNESRVQYYVDREQLIICTAEVARQRIISWWNAQPPAYEKQFAQDKAASTRKSNLRIGF